MHKTETEKGNASATDAATLTRLKRLLVYDRDMYFSKTLKDLLSFSFTNAAQLDNLTLLSLTNVAQLGLVNAAQLGCRCSFE